MEEAWLKWADLAKERIVLTVEVKKVPKLEADVVDLQKTIIELRNIHQTEIERLRSIHQAETERKDAFYESENVWVLKELHASYNAKLPWFIYGTVQVWLLGCCDETERIAHRDPKPSSEDAAVPTRIADMSEPINAGEARGWKEASRADCLNLRWWLT